MVRHQQRAPYLGTLGPGDPTSLNPWAFGDDFFTPNLKPQLTVFNTVLNLKFWIRVLWWIHPLSKSSIMISSILYTHTQTQFCAQKVSVPGFEAVWLWAQGELSDGPALPNALWGPPWGLAQLQWVEDGAEARLQWMAPVVVVNHSCYMFFCFFFFLSGVFSLFLLTFSPNFGETPDFWRSVRRTRSEPSRPWGLYMGLSGPKGGASLLIPSEKKSTSIRNCAGWWFQIFVYYRLL